MELARDVLIALGDSPVNAAEAIRRFRSHDEELLATQQKLQGDEASAYCRFQAGVGGT